MIHARTSWKVLPGRSLGSLCNGSIGGATSPLERNASLAKSRWKESLSRRTATGPPHVPHLLGALFIPAHAAHLMAAEPPAQGWFRGRI